MKLPHCITVIIMTLLPLLATADAIDCTAARACPMLAVISGARAKKDRERNRRKAQETLTPQEFEKWCQEEERYYQRLHFVEKWLGVGFGLLMIWLWLLSWRLSIADGKRKGKKDKKRKKRMKRKWKKRKNR